MKSKKLLLAFGLVTFSFLTSHSMAAISWSEKDDLGAAESPLPDSSLPLQNQVILPQVALKPALDVWGMFGKYNTAKGQVLWPFGGNTQTSAFYGMFEGSVANNKSGWLLGPGAGYRKAFDCTYILGGYLIADYNQSPQGHGFVVANPGFEALWEKADVRVNGYLPLNGHRNYYQQNQWFEEVAPGIDGEVGSEIPGLFGLKAFIGGYHFEMSDTNKIDGIAARLEFPVKKFFILTARASHDNVEKGTIIAGVKISLGGVPETETGSTGVNGRLMDPIEHNMAAFAKGAGIPISKGLASNQ